MYANPESETTRLDEATTHAKEHGFTIEATDQFGTHSGRQRFKVVCDTCGNTVHKATTGPVPNMETHRERCPGAEA